MLAECSYCSHVAMRQTDKKSFKTIISTAALVFGGSFAVKGVEVGIDL